MSDETREYFESVADKWDEMRRTFFGEGVRNSAMAAAGITPSSVVVDVGTGTGFMAEGALAAGAHVVGVDSSNRMPCRREATFRNRPSRRESAMSNHCRFEMKKRTWFWRIWCCTTHRIRRVPFTR